VSTLSRNTAHPPSIASVCYFGPECCPNTHNTYSHTDGRPAQLRTTDRAAPKEPTEAEISELMEAAPEGMDKINWIMFLTMFAEKMDGEPLPCL
jgi:hypothetical protein